MCPACEQHVGCMSAGAEEDICDLPLYPEDLSIECRAHIPSWTYNATAGSCEDFIYGGCGATANIFGSEQECQQTCGPPSSNGSARNVATCTVVLASWVWMSVLAARFML